MFGATVRAAQYVVQFRTVGRYVTWQSQAPVRESLVCTPAPKPLLTVHAPVLMFPDCYNLAHPCPTTRFTKAALRPRRRQALRTPRLARHLVGSV